MPNAKKITTSNFKVWSFVFGVWFLAFGACTRHPVTNYNLRSIDMPFALRIFILCQPLL